MSNKSPIVAAVLSFCFGGVGQFYLGQTHKGLLLTVLATILFLVPVVGSWILVFGAVDAYSIGRKLDRGASVGEWEFRFDRVPMAVGIFVGMAMTVALLMALRSLRGL